MGDIKASTIDFYVICERVLPYVHYMKIDNGKNHMLTNFNNVDKNGMTVNSDHFPLTMNIKLEIEPLKRDKIDVLNFNDLNSQMLFKDMTSNTTVFSECLQNVHKVSEGAKLWIGTVKSFKKIRFRTRKIRQSAADKLISERNKLLRQGNIKDSKNLDAKIAQIISEEGRVRAFMLKKYTDTSHSACLSEM